VTDAFRPCAVIPTYDNPATIRAVVEGVRPHVADVVVVDDGSGAAGRAAVDAIASSGLARVERRAKNGGKGAAVKTGFATAQRLGATHVLQIDADGQHDLADVPRFLAEARAHPDALILGRPVFDATQPRARAFARQISIFWVSVETGGRAIADPQCGFRVYPLAPALAARAEGDHMEFDLELPVRMVWAGIPVRNLPTRVRYLSKAEGGVSHFDVVRDNARISWLHTRLVFGAARRALSSIAGTQGGRRSRPTRSEAKPSEGRSPSASE
jgi:glycosyltransferase involved in cell wall biosynthesis